MSAGVFDVLPDEYASLPLCDYGGALIFPGMVDLHIHAPHLGMDDSILPHPKTLNLAERMERAVYLGLDSKKIDAKYVSGRKIF